MSPGNCDNYCHHFMIASVMQKISERFDMKYLFPIRKKYFFFLSIALWSLLTPLYGQTPFETLHETWRWTRFTTVSGLPSNQVYDVVETSDGIIWAATKGGLAWYDNFRWHLIDKSRGLPERKPERLMAGLAGKLLLIMSDTLYQGDKQGFVPIYLKFENDEDDHAQSAVPMEDDEILIGATKSLYTYKDGVIKSFPTPSRILTDRGLNLWKTKSKKIWLNTIDGMYQLNGKKWILRLPRKKSAFGVETIVEDETGTGVLAFVRPPEDQGLWEWEKNEPPKRSQTERSALVQSVDIAPNGNVIAAYESGEIRIRQNRRWSSLHPSPSEMTRVLFLKFRSNGNLWVGTENGLFLHKSSSTRWSRWSHLFADLKNSVHEIFQASDGTIWLGTLNGIEILFPDGRVRSIEKINGVTLHTITGINEDSEHNIWVGSGATFDGAFKWNGRSWSHVGASEGLAAPRVHKIRKDRQGRLWFLGLGVDYSQPKNQPGAFLYADERFTRWGIEEGLPSGRVYAFAEDQEGAYWFGTMGGLSRWKNKKWTHWDGKNQLFMDRIFTLAVDQTNRVWFSDQHNGLGYIDENDQVRYLTSSDGLINNEIWDIRADDRRKLWISTRGGLCSYENGIWTRFDTNTGLSTLRLWEVLPLKDKVYVGSSGSGLNILNLREMGLPPLIEFTKPVIQNDEALLRWQVFPYFGEVAPQEVEIRFRLDNGPWFQWNTLREINFTNLEEGKHVFQVQAKGLFGNFNPTGFETSFTIEPSWYWRPLFLLPLSILSLALAFTGLAYLDRKRKQDIALRESEERFRKIFEEGPIGMATFDSQYRFINTNATLCTMLGYTEKELAKLTFIEITHPDELEKDIHSTQRLMKGEIPFYRIEKRYLKKNRESVWVNLTASTVRDSAGKPMYGIAMVENITERKKAEEALRSLPKRIIEAQESERRRVARDLHDSASQILGSVKFRIQSLEEKIPARNSTMRKKVASTKQLIDKVVSEIRRISHNLRPSELDDLGLAAALRTLAEEFTERTSITIECSLETLPKTLPSEMELTIYRIIQEALTNVEKHAKATHVALQLSQEDGFLKVKIHDNGKGLKRLALPTERGKKSGMGLIDIQERLMFSKGTINIISGAQKGTEILIRIPLNNLNNEKE